MNRRSVLRAGGFGLAGVLSSTAWAARSGAAVSIPTSETGTVTRDQPDGDTWYSVSLENSYTDPVVVMKPVSMDGPHPVHVRLRDVSGGSFEFKFEEWKYLDGGHATATAHYAVVEAGTYTLPNGTTLEAGHTEADEGWRSVSFSASFGSTPVVFSQAQTANGGQPIVTRNQRVSTEGFVVRVQEEEALGSHVTESVGYIAVEPTVSSGYEVSRTADTVTENWHEIRFEQMYDSAVLIADMQTADGANTAGLRYDELDGGSVNVVVEEERSDDDEINHVTEQVGYLVATPGALFGGGSGGDGDDGDSVTILEDFESRSLSGYTGDTGGFSFDTSSAIEASASLRGTSAGATITAGEIETPRGYEYRCRVVPRAGSYQRMLVNVQDASNPMQNCYALFVGPNWSDIAVQDRRNGSRADFVNASHSFTAGTEYIAGISVTAEGVWGTLYDVDGNQLAQTPPMDSTVHSGGNLGFSVGPETGVLWDEVTRVERGSPPNNDDGSTDPANDAPTTSDDSASVENGRTVTVNVLSNDSDADGTLDPSTVSVVTQPSNGSTTVNSDGSIDYTHNGSDTQSDSFGYTVSDDAGATSNEATVSLDVTQPDSGRPGDDYYTGDTHQSSNYNSVQAAVNDLSARDTLVLDDMKTISSEVDLKSDIRIQGDSNTSPHIRVSQGSGSDGLRPEGVSNVLIDGVVIDGQRGSGSTNNNPGTNSLIGGRGLGKVSNLRIINCSILESGGNGMTFHCDSSNAELQDIYVGFNTFDKPFRHGILFGTDPGGSGGPNAPSLIHDVIVEGNSVTNWYKAQAYGCFGENGGWSENVAFIGNTADHSVMRDNEAGFILEEQTRHCLHFANSINDATGNCFSSSKNGYRNLHANNEGTNSSSASGCFVGSFRYHVGSSQDYGPEPHDNVCTKNVFENNTNGLRTQFTTCDNYFYDNYLTYTDGNRFVKRQLINCSSSGVYDKQNSSSVSKSGKGVPDGWETTTQISYETPSGSTGASAQWSRGSIDPNDAVSVDVSVNSSAW